MTDKAFVYFEDQAVGAQRLYENPLEIIEAWSADEVTPALKRMAAYQRGGKYLAGYFAYELGLLFEDTLRPLLPKNLAENSTGPLLQFGVFDKFSNVDLPNNQDGHINGLKPAWSLAQYQKRFAQVMDLIEAGDVYQVNLPFPLRGTYCGGGASIYQKLKSAQPVKYGGVISLGGAEIVSLSPELFFELEGGKITMRPMKGTSRRGLTPKRDTALAKALQMDAKNRAENLMIVDLLRNDLSRIAVRGSVKVSDLYRLETYPSLHTMTSGIEAQLADISLGQILQALFPCGSVTGAPKIRATEIIRALEASPRGAYCGAVGLIDPNGDMRFNVGIRTLVLHEGGTCTYGVGSGVVADSDANAEYEECLLKAAFLQDGFGLIETFGWHEDTGFMWLDLHLGRLQRSAEELGFSFGEKDIAQALEAATANLSGPHKIRMQLNRNGQFDVQTSPLSISAPGAIMPVSLSQNTLSSSDKLLAHKTTRRQFIESELARLQTETGCKEVLFFNERGELCEGSYTNVFVEKGGKTFTPPLPCGLLPGIMREVMLANGEVVERVLYIDDLLDADAIYVGNSVRGLMKAGLTDTAKQ